tara:strand:+ start:1619 stop:1858 length:240 start_codon:yes stop_codon:yes gene_type:complete
MGFNKQYITSDMVVNRYNDGSKGHGVVRLFIRADANIVSGTLAQEVDDIMSSSFSIEEAAMNVDEYFTHRYGEKNYKKT